MGAYIAALNKAVCSLYAVGMPRRQSFAETAGGLVNMKKGIMPKISSISLLSTLGVLLVEWRAYLGLLTTGGRGLLSEDLTSQSLTPRSGGGSLTPGSHVKFPSENFSGAVAARPVPTPPPGRREGRGAYGPKPVSQTSQSKNPVSQTPGGGEGRAAWLSRFDGGYPILAIDICNQAPKSIQMKQR